MSYSGRPRIQTVKRYTTCIALPETLVEQVDNIAQLRNMSRTKVIEEVLQKMCKKWEKDHSSQTNQQIN